MITLLIVIFTILFAAGSLSSLLVTDDVEHIVGRGR
jgi:hypothetical protein